MSTCTPTTSSRSDPFNPSKEQTHFDSGPSSHLHDYFNKQAKEYEAKAGDVTRSIARKAVGYLGKLKHDARVHDNASGPAIFASELLKVYPGAHVTCTDNAQGMVDVIEKLVKETPGWEGYVFPSSPSFPFPLPFPDLAPFQAFVLPLSKPIPPNRYNRTRQNAKLTQNASRHISATLMSGEHLSFPSCTFSASLTNFAIFMMSPPSRAASEIHRTLKPGGVAIVSTWRTAGWPRLLRAIQTTYYPRLHALLLAPPRALEPILYSRGLFAGGRFRGCGY
ncbi:hypothetical protein G7Y79_00013g033980 [Physcia stellaris]|nr:hypothetical protein G7Y79_00013g033980 [Physcia stellaris]